MIDPSTAANKLAAEINTLPERNTASIRSVRRKMSRRIHEESPRVVRSLAESLLKKGVHRWVAYELIAEHRRTFLLLDRRWLEQLGKGMDSWHAVDEFARILSGPAWRDGLVDDETIAEWANSQDRWWRRAALVSTVALNMRSQGGKGDSQKTLAICTKLAADHDDMVVKALSWALRELIVHDYVAVKAFLEKHNDLLAARVKREVRNKLETGLKNPIAD